MPLLISLFLLATLVPCGAIITIPILPSYDPYIIRDYPTPYSHLLHPIDEVSLQIAADSAERFESTMVQYKRFKHDRLNVLNAFYPESKISVHVGDASKCALRGIQPYTYIKSKKGKPYYLSTPTDCHFVIVQFNEAVHGVVDQVGLERLLARHPRIVKVLNPLGADGKRRRMMPFPLFPNYHPSYLKGVSYQILFQMLMHAAPKMGQIKTAPHCADHLTPCGMQLERGMQRFFPGSRMQLIAAHKGMRLLGWAKHLFEPFTKGEVLYYPLEEGEILPKGMRAPFDGVLIDYSPPGPYNANEEFGTALQFGQNQEGVDVGWIDDATKGIFIYADPSILKDGRTPPTLFASMQHAVYDKCCLM